MSGLMKFRGLSQAAAFTAVLALAALVVMFTGGTAAHSSQTQIKLDLTPTRPPSPGTWVTFSDEQLGFTVSHPSAWRPLDTSRTSWFKGKCFGATPDGVPIERPYSIVHFCVDLDPWVRVHDTGFASESESAQQEFFAYLAAHDSGAIWSVDATTYEVTGHWTADGAETVERIESDAPGSEGTEPGYIVAGYINHPRLGLIRLSFQARTAANLEQYRDLWPEIRSSFKVLEWTPAS